MRTKGIIYLVSLTLLMSTLGVSCSNAATLPVADLPVVSEQGLAPNFRFSLYQGSDILGSVTKELAELRGMPVVLNFWARLCPPCWSEMPELQEFHEEFEETVLLLGIDIGQFTGLGDPRDASKILDAMGITYPVGFTNDGLVVEQYGVLAMPTTVFIDRQGRIFHKWTGALERSTVTRLTRSMLTREAE